MKKLMLMLLIIFSTNLSAQQVVFSRTSSIITNVKIYYHNISYDNDSFDLTNYLFQNEDTINDGIPDGTENLNALYVKEFTYKSKTYYLLVIDKTIHSYTIYVRNKPIRVNTYNKKYCYIFNMYISMEFDNKRKK